MLPLKHVLSLSTVHPCHSGAWIKSPVAAILLSATILLCRATADAEQINGGSLSYYGVAQEVIAEGAAGTVFMFNRSSDDLLFAVKEFIPDQDQHYGDWYQGIIKNEFQIGISLQQEHIIKTLDLVFSDGKWFQVMEYCPQTLWQLVAMTDDGLPADSANCIFRQLVDGIAYMHHKGVAHQDLKLNNIMLNVEGQVKIIDFGISYRFRDPFDQSIQLIWGPRGGTPHIPPEVYDVPKYDPRPVDIWALAIIFCEMMQPSIPWKRSPAAEDVLDDYFGLFSPSAVITLEKQQLGQDKSDDNNDEWENGPETIMDKIGAIRGTIENLLGLLPEESRPLIQRMLEPLPNQRANFTEIFADSWFASIVCAGDSGDGSQIYFLD